jgi:hypothetical protein
MSVSRMSPFPSTMQLFVWRLGVCPVVGLREESGQAVALGAGAGADSDRRPTISGRTSESFVRVWLLSQRHHRKNNTAFLVHSGGTKGVKLVLPVGRILLRSRPQGSQFKCSGLVGKSVKIRKSFPCLKSTYSKHLSKGNN